MNILYQLKWFWELQMKFTLISGKSASTYVGTTLSFLCNVVISLFIPVCFPDVNGIFILDVMFFCLFIKKIKEVFHSWWHHVVWVEHTMKEVIYKLLKCSLKVNLKEICITSWTQCYPRVFFPLVQLQLLKVINAECWGCQVTKNLANSPNSKNILENNFMF